MEIALLIVLVALLARVARSLGMMDARAHRAGAGLFDGLFALSREYSRSGELGWPSGVQEEDRDRIWSWEAPPQTAEGDLIDRDVAPVPVRRVR